MTTAASAESRSNPWSRLERRLNEAYDHWLDQLVDPREPFHDDEGNWLHVGAGLDDRTAGESAGSETALTEIRRQCRWLAASNEFAINGHENRVSYIVGTGSSFRVAVKRGYEVPPATIAAAQRLLDDFLYDNQWHRRQQEMLWRLDRDGEVFLRWFTGPDGALRVRCVEPGQVFAPPSALNDPAASFGILTRCGDVETVEGYFIDGELVTAADVQHRKANVDLNVKRGLPLYYPVRKNLRRAEKLLRNMSVVAEIQSAIALIRRHRAGRSAVQQFISQDPGSSPIPSSLGAPAGVRRYGPGTILDASGDVEYDFPVAAIDAGRYVTVLQAELRAIAARLVMPEFMFSSDASNANFASTLVAEGPAVKMFERWQAHLREYDLRVVWRVLDHAMGQGRLPIGLAASIEIEVGLPTLLTRNQRVETESNEILHRARILSPQTWSQRAGLEYDQERANWRSHDQRGDPIKM